jgi:hypothetical protein
LGYNTGALLYSEDGSNYQIPMTNFLTASKSFDVGFTITSIKEEIVYGGQRLVWTGVYPKTVPSGSTPDTTGGIGSGAWAYSNDSVLRENLRSSEGGASSVYGLGFWADSVEDILASTYVKDSIFVRGFYSAGDGGEGVWLITGNKDLSKAGTHIPATARIYNAIGIEYRLAVKSGDVISAAANGLRAVADISLIDEKTEDFICVGEVVNGITSQIKTMKSSDDLNSYLTVTIPMYYPLRLGKTPIKAFSRLTIDAQQTAIYVRPSPANTHANTGVWMNAVERGIEDIQHISNLYSGSASYGNLTLSDFHLLGGKFYGDHSTDKSYIDCSTGTGLMTYNMENSSVENTWFQGFAVGRQYLRTTKGYYFDNLGNKIAGTIIPEVSSASSGSYEGVHEIDVTSYGIRYLHLRTVSNWGRFDKLKFGTYADWSRSPDGSSFNYFIENYGAGVVFTGGVIEANTMAAGPLKGFVLDKARGCSFIGVYYENATGPGWTIMKPDNSSSYRGNGLHISSLGSYYLSNSKGQPLVAFEQGFFGNYTQTGKYTRGGWETSYSYFAGPNTWSVGQPTHDSGAFPHGGYDFKYATYGIHYSTNIPDVDSLRDTLEGNEFLSPYGLQVNSGILLFPLRFPAHQSNIVIWYKDLTGNFDPRQAVVGLSDNINTTDDSSVNLYVTNGVRLFDYGNGYKALLIPYVNPRPLDGRLVSSGAGKLKITVTSDAPIILKSIQAFVGGVPFFPVSLADYIPKSQLDRVWGTMSSDGSAGAYYSQEIGGGIFKPGDTVLPLVPFNHASLTNPAAYSDMSGSFGSGLETKTVTGGACWGQGLSGATITLTITSVDTTNGWTTVSVPENYLPYIFAGMSVYVVTNSGGGSVGLLNIIRRVTNSTGTLSNNYVLNGNLGAVGGTLTVSTTSNYSIRTGKTSVYSGTTGSFATDGWLGAVGGDIRCGFGGSGSGTRQLRFYYDSTNVSAGIGSNGASALYLTGLGGITVNGSLLTSTSYSFGGATAYPANIYSQNAVTVVSDENLKMNIRPISTDDEYKKLAAAVASVPFSAWQLKSAVAIKGQDSARWHVGVIAQQVKDAITNAGLDWTKYGLITYEEVSQHVSIVDGGYYPILTDGEELSKIPVTAAGNIEIITGADTITEQSDGTAIITRGTYMMRMEEFLVLRMSSLEQ